MEAALAVAGGLEVEDLAEDYRRGEQVVESLRDGFPPSLRIFENHNAELVHVAERIGHLIGDGRDPGDMLVATSANWQVEMALEALRVAGVPAMALTEYDGVTTPFVKVGTSLRSKGLEFKVVFVPFLGEDRFPRKRPTGQTDEERAEERAQGLSRLFVAMTRARDLLFLTASGPPIVELQRAEKLLEWRV
jgi:superfamily I DNA/RNA helicase